jgi:hypothetical protein
MFIITDFEPQINNDFKETDIVDNVSGTLIESPY